MKYQERQEGKDPEDTVVTKWSQVRIQGGAEGIIGKEGVGVMQMERGKIRCVGREWK